MNRWATLDRPSGASRRKPFTKKPFTKKPFTKKPFTKKPFTDRSIGRTYRWLLGVRVPVFALRRESASTIVGFPHPVGGAHPNLGGAT